MRRGGPIIAAVRRVEITDGGVEGRRGWVGEYQPECLKFNVDALDHNAGCTRRTEPGKMWKQTHALDSHKSQISLPMHQTRRRTLRPRQEEEERKKEEEEEERKACPP